MVEVAAQGSPFPDPIAVLTGSRWLEGVPGLPEHVLLWREELTPRRARLQERARRIATPRSDPRMAVRSAQIGAELAQATARLARRRLANSFHSKGVAREVRRTFERLGPTYIKFGQLISCAVGLVPPEVAEEFGKCRDAVPADPASAIRRVVTSELGPMEQLFADFEDEPLASASIAQVHRATLLDGRDVVVKVRHPGVRRRFLDDIAIMAWQGLVLDSLGRLDVVNPRGLVELFASQVVEELDLRIEALNMCEVGASIEHSGVDYLHCPRPMPGLVTQRVLVMERLEGVSYTDVEAIREAGVDTRLLLDLGIKAVLEGTLIYGVFHGDLHAGNLAVKPPDSFSLYDFGIVGRLTEAQRLALVRFVTAAFVNDVDSLVDALREFGSFPEGTDLEEVGRALGAKVARIEADVTERAETFGLDDLVQVIGAVMATLSRSGFRMPTQLALIAKNFLYLNAAIQTLAPDMDLMEIVVPLVFTFAGSHGSVLAQVGADQRAIANQTIDRRGEVVARLVNGRLGAAVMPGRKPQTPR